MSASVSRVMEWAIAAQPIGVPAVPLFSKRRRSRPVLPPARLPLCSLTGVVPRRVCRCPITRRWLQGRLRAEGSVPDVKQNRLMKMMKRVASEGTAWNSWVRGERENGGWWCWRLETVLCASTVGYHIPKYPNEMDIPFVANSFLSGASRLVLMARIFFVPGGGLICQSTQVV